MSEFNWSAHPALRVALALATGILLADLPALDRALCLGALGVAATLLALLRGPVRGAAMLVTVAASGAILAALERSSNVQPALDARRAECVGELAEAPRPRLDGIELVIACDSIILRNEIARTDARVLVRVDRTEDAAIEHRDALAELRRGARVAIRGALRTPNPAALPGAFDERRYLGSRGISFVLEVDAASQVHVARAAVEISIDRGLEWARSGMRSFAREHVGGSEGEVVEALLSGDREGIDRSTREAFAATGTLHVLAVSGLHVAVIALGLSVLTSWMPDRRLQFVTFALVLGLYTLVTGAGPSIVRAWCMATCFMLARLVGRRTRALNVLAASAVLILVAHPADLHDIGFQLSFGAVAGIILVNGRLLTALDTLAPSLRRRPLIDWTIRSLAMTASAQVLTLPLLLMHFGSTPALGLLLNVPVVPLTSCAMAAAAIGVLALPAPPLAAALGAASYVATRLAVAIVTWGATLPYASISTLRLAPPLALAVIIGWVWASRAVRARDIAFRAFMTLVIVGTGSFVARDGDPLRAAAHPRAYIVPAAGGVMVATLEHDSLVVVTASSTPAAMKSVALLERSLGARGVRIIEAKGSPSVSRTGWRVAIGIAPIVVDNSRATVRCASHGGSIELVAGLRGRLERMLVLEFNRRWYPVTWH